MLAIQPDLVRMDEARPHLPDIATTVNGLPFAGLNWNSRRRSMGLVSTKTISEQGHWGRPELATAEKGEALLERCAQVLAKHLLTYVLDVREPAGRHT
jgi:creatinine amidohydrolase/Fe(II)-dependent formamide hydrolase-like protein